VNVALLVGLLGGFAFLMAQRPLPGSTPPPAVAALPESSAPASETASEVTPTAAAKIEEVEAPAVPAAPESPDAPPQVLRVAGLGWELLAPGVLANDGLEPGPASEFTGAK